MSRRRSDWARCQCGKVLCDSEADARRKAAAQAFITGHEHPIDVYACRTQPGIWHWEDTGIESTMCACGREQFSQSTAHKEVARINRGRAGERLEARSYACPAGGHHWLWYPKGKRFRYCKDCNAPAYPDPGSAQLVAEHIPGDHRVFQCTSTRWHLTAGPDLCEQFGTHQGKPEWVIHDGEAERWWSCCGEVDGLPLI
jgi:hypothetical protein